MKKKILFAAGMFAIFVLVLPVKAAFCQKMVIPAYFYPGALWDKAASGAATVGVLIMNPASGPGMGQNPDYVFAVKKAQAAGSLVIGYVHTSYGGRDAAIVKSEIDNFKAWYAVDGIFLDEVSSDASLVPYYQDLANHIRAAAGTFVILNPGTIPAEGYMNVGNTVAVFEGTYNAYKNWRALSWAVNYSPAKFTHLVYAVSNSTAMKYVVKWSVQRRAGYIFATNDLLPNPWDTLPRYWLPELAEINKSCN